MSGTYIDIPSRDGGSFRGYLSTPPTGHGPGLVVIQEIFGVNRHIRAVADDYAHQGYVVLAPDLFRRAEAGVELGYGAADAQRGSALRQQIGQEPMLRDLEDSAAALRARTDTDSGIGAVGYCMGGRLAFALAATSAIDAAVSYYGGGSVTLLDRVPDIDIPLQFHFGALDEHIPFNEVSAIRSAFAQRTDVEVFVYDEAGHGFNCDQRDSYHQPSAELARARALQFLRANIGPE